MVLQANAPTVSFILLTISWISWRFWAFTLHPRLHPNSPKVIPYVVPWFSHIVGFFKDRGTLITASQLRYAPNRKPSNISMCGQNTYIITSSKDTSAVFRNVTDLTFNAYVRKLLSRFSISQSAFSAMWAEPSESFVKARIAAHGFPNPNKKPLMHQSKDIIKVQLHPGAELEALEASLVALIQQELVENPITNFAVLNRTGKTECIVSLEMWTKHCMLETATKAFFGEAILRLEPTILQTFVEFDDNSWKFTSKLPPFFAKDVYTAQVKLQRAFVRYVKLPLNKRSDACWLTKTLEAEMRAVGTSDSDVGAYFLLVFWPLILHGNPWKLTFWLMSHLLYQPELKKRLLDEIKPLLKPKTPLHPTKLCQKLNELPLLTAIYHETLRLTSSTVTVRDVVNDCVIGNKLLQKDSRILIPYRQMFLDESVFGPDTLSFHPDRFLDNPSLSKDPSFRPFGGGLTYCPGRFLARKEIFAMVVMMLTNFNIKLENPSAPFPEIDEKKPGLGTMFPSVGGDVRIRVVQK